VGRAQTLRWGTATVEDFMPTQPNRPTLLFAALTALVLAACAPSAPPPAPEDAPPAPAADPPAVAASPAPPPPPADAELSTQAQVGFIDKVWRVESSSAVAVGTDYAFLADGTLAIAAPRAKPAFGRWTYAGGRLAMIEEGHTYPTDIVTLDETRFVIRSHNPGAAVDITLVPAEGVALPKAPKP
jgi:hypothetical protein